jgi:hypothetical protein
MRASSEPLYVSRNHLEGSLCDTSIDRLLAACRKHLVTGVIRVHMRGRDGVVELRAGAVSEANLGELAGDHAMIALRSADDGWYELAQRLPDLSGDLAGGAQLEGDVEGVPLIALMRHCEDHALTCTITVISGFDRACIEYRAGEIARVELNGFFDDDALPQILRWPEARFRIAAPPLDLDIDGWPIPRRAPTVPERIRVPDRMTAACGRSPQGTPRLAEVSGEIVTATRLFTAPPAIVFEPTPLPRRRRRRPTTRGRDWSKTADVLWLLATGALILGLGITGLLWAS